MRKELKFHRYGFLLICFASAPGLIFGQDLGSSSGLFSSGSKSKTTSKTATKKTAPKLKTAAAAKKPAAKDAKETKDTPKAKTATAAAKSDAAKSNAAKSEKSDSQKTATAKAVAPKNNLIKAPSKAGAKPDSKSQTAAKQPTKTNAPTKNVVITIGQPVGAAAPAQPKGDFDELFEKSIEEGNQARDEREYSKAEAAYLRAQSLKTKDARAIYGLGNLYSDQQRWEEAEAAYRTAIGFDSNGPEAYIALSYVLTQPLVGMDLGGRYAEAEKMARQAINLDSKNAIAFDQLGVALELSGGVGGETKNAYRRAIQLDPNFALAYAHLGRLLRRNGLNTESSAAYRSAIEMSSDVPTMIMVADVMQSQQRYLDSEELLRRALQQDPKNPTALYLLGRALTTRGSFDEAEKVLKKSADISPNSFVAYALLGSLYTRREKFDDAEKYLLKALKLVSLNERKRLAQDFEAVGDGLMRTGKNKDAVRVYRQAAALDREKVSLSDKLAKTQAN